MVAAKMFLCINYSFGADYKYYNFKVLKLLRNVKCFVIKRC